MITAIYNFLNGRSPAANLSTPITTNFSGNKGIHYDSCLIPELENDHARLVNLFGEIWSDCFLKKDYKKMAAKLDSFKYEFQSHILKENVKFYVYLEQNLADDAHSLDIIKEFRRDMNGIANAVIKFCRKYNEPKLSAELAAEFEEDYNNIGSALTKRVTLEERDLYILYSK